MGGQQQAGGGLNCFSLRGEIGVVMVGTGGGGEEGCQAAQMAEQHCK